MGGIKKDIHAHIPGVFVLRPGEDPLVVQFGSPPGEGWIEPAGVGLDRSRLHMQEDGIHDTGAEPGDLKPVPKQVFLIISAVVGDQFLLPLPLVHLKGVVDAMELNDFALCIK